MPLSLPGSLPPALDEALASLRASEAVQGILLVGSRSRNEASRRADYDLEIVVDDAFFRTLKFHMTVGLVWDGKPHASLLLGDTLTLPRSELEARVASPLDSDHWPYERAALWHDRDGEIAPLVARLAAFPEEAWEPRLRLHYVEAWLAIARALQAEPRGDALNLALALAEGARAWLRTLFVLNRRWPPSAHAASAALGRLPHAPARAAERLADALHRQSPAILQSLHEELAPLLDAEGQSWHADPLPLLLSVQGPWGRAARERWGAR